MRDPVKSTLTACTLVPVEKMPLFLVFLIVPLIEIALFIQVGGWLGLWPTLAIVVLTAFAGTLLLRSQGSAAMRDLQRSFNDLRDPSEPLAHGAMILFAGALLLTPGFFTDAIGLSLMIPGVRSRLFKLLRDRIAVRSVHMSGGPRPDAPRDRVIDADFEDVTDEERPNRGNSGWTGH